MGMEAFMLEALLDARGAFDEGEVPVGCVFIYQNNTDTIIARGGNLVNVTKNATRHAELICIDQVLEFCAQNGMEPSAVFPHISVVVTVEPCIMCSAALHGLGVKEILYGCVNDRFGGKTVVDVPQVIGIQLPVRGGICAEDAMNLLKTFYKGTNPSAPIPKTRK